jgi:4-hydroxythreonine-4-phosphate dehydrogenase
MRDASGRPRIAVTLGDPRGIGPEVTQGALGSAEVADAADFVVIGPDPDSLPSAFELPEGAEFNAVGSWTSGGDRQAGEISGAAIEAGIAMALAGEVDGLVTAPIAKTALRAAGYDFPGHTELLRDRCAVPDVTMIMAAEETVLGGPLRLALLTVHVALRTVPEILDVDLVVRRSAIAARALREWWGMERPRLALAGVNPHASEQGLFGDEEERVLAPAATRLADTEDVVVAGIFPADTVFRRCIDGSVDLVVVPYHDVGLAVLKTLAGDTGVNVTAGLPFPRTSPDHGTAFDIAGRGLADPSSMKAAVAQCIRFCRRGR